jgi:hypothetical protein
VILAAGSASKSPLEIKSSGKIEFEKYLNMTNIFQHNSAANEVTMYIVQH